MEEEESAGWEEEEVRCGDTVDKTIIRTPLK